MNNHKENFNEPCEFAEQMVAHLYGEASEAEKLRLDAHLRDCQACGDEFTDFNSVLYSIREWRAQEFDVLPTPVFVLSKAGGAATVSHSWLDSIRGCFLFSPAWAAMIPIFILVFGGLVFWWTTGTVKNDLANGDTIAEANRKMIQKTVPKENENPATSAPTNSSTNSAADSFAQHNSAGNQKQSDAAKTDAAKTNAPKDSALPSSPAMLNTAKNQSPTMVKKSGGAKGNVKTSNKLDIPSLAADGDEDDDLQLADLFEEVSLK